MKTRLKIGDFAKLNGITVKTVLYYHKIGLLGEPERSSGGYRLYGVEELSRVVSIKRLKNIGLNLEQIRAILGGAEENPSAASILQSLLLELEAQIQALQARANQIQKILEGAPANLSEYSRESQSFKRFLDILGPEAEETYKNRCPELYAQDQQLCGLMDDLQWGVDYQALMSEAADFFKHHPDQYQLSLDYGAQISAIASLSPDSPVIEDLARNYGEYIISLPIVNKLLAQTSNQKSTFEPLLDQMFGEVLTAAQMRFMELLRRYVVPE